MAGKPSKPMTPFDKSVTPSYLYKLKLFLSFLPPSTQRFLAVYIKFSEFRYTMDYFRGLPFHAFSFQSIGELTPYMDENERNMMRFLYLFNNGTIEACGQKSIYDSSTTTIPSNSCKMISISFTSSKFPVGELGEHKNMSLVVSLTALSI